MDIRKALKEEYKYLSKRHEVYGIFLYGSQNYGLATEKSDIDTKAIIIPSFEDLVFNAPVSKVYDFGWGECDVKDIREMVKNYKKQNVNYIETLFTNHYYTNPKYENFHMQLLQNRGEISLMDPKRALDCMNGMLMQAKKRMLHVADVTRADIEQYGYHRKSLINVLKMASMIDKYASGQRYSDVLDCSELRKFQNADIPKERAIAAAEKYDRHCAETIKNYIEKNSPVVNEAVSKRLDEWCLQIIKAACE